MNAKIRKARRAAAKAAPHNLPTVASNGRVLGPSSFRAEFFESVLSAVDVNGHREYQTKQVAAFDGDAFDEFVDYYRTWAKAHRKPLVSPKGNVTSPDTGVGEGFRVRPALKVEKEGWLGRFVEPANGLTRARIFSSDGKTAGYVDATGPNFRGQVVSASPGGVWVYVPGVGFWAATTDNLRVVSEAGEAAA